MNTRGLSTAKQGETKSIAVNTQRSFIILFSCVELFGAVCAVENRGRFSRTGINGEGKVPLSKLTLHSVALAFCSISLSLTNYPARRAGRERMCSARPKRRWVTTE